MAFSDSSQSFDMDSSNEQPPTPTGTVAERKYLAEMFRSRIKTEQGGVMQFSDSQRIVLNVCSYCLRRNREARGY